MRKQVTFVEEIRRGEKLTKRTSVLTTRSAESKSYKHNFEDSLSLCNEQNVAFRRPRHFKVPDNQQVKTVHIPKSMMAAPFLQHPTLTTGQKRYLYSIANVYSTEHMKQMMKQHYLNVLHRCIKSGHNSMGSSATSGENLHKGRCVFKMDTERASGSGAKPVKNTALHSKIILPKIAKQ